MLERYYKLLDLREKEETFIDYKIKQYKKINSMLDISQLTHHLYREFLQHMETPGVSHLYVNDSRVFFDYKKQTFTFYEGEIKSPSIVPEKVFINMSPMNFFGSARKIFNLTQPEWYKTIANWFYTIHCQKIDNIILGKPRKPLVTQSFKKLGKKRFLKFLDEINNFAKEANLKGESLMYYYPDYMRTELTYGKRYLVSARRFPHRRIQYKIPNGSVKTHDPNLNCSYHYPNIENFFKAFNKEAKKTNKEIEKEFERKIEYYIRDAHNAADMGAYGVVAMPIMDITKIPYQQLAVSIEYTLALLLEKSFIEIYKKQKESLEHFLQFN